MICLACERECSVVEINDGFFYDYGDIVGAWHDESGEGSACCGSEVAPGKIWMDKTSTHRARKNHKDAHGKVVVSKGSRYLAGISKGYYVLDGERHPIYNYYKRQLGEGKC